MYCGAMSSTLRCSGCTQKYSRPWEALSCFQFSSLHFSWLAKSWRGSRVAVSPIMYTPTPPPSPILRSDYDRTYPMLKELGIDMTEPEIYQALIPRMNRQLGELEVQLGQRE